MSNAWVRWWMVMLLLSSAPGCRTLGWGRDPAVPPVRVVAADPRFEEEGSGELALVLEVQNPWRGPTRVQGITWELWLEGRWFATGTQLLDELVAPEQSRALTLRFPLAYPKRPLSSGPASLGVGVRGGLIVSDGGPPTRWSFERRWRQTLPRAPIFDRGAEDD